MAVLDTRPDHDVAHELYARGFTLTRDEANRMVAKEPLVVRVLLSGDLGRHLDDEIGTSADRAGRQEWGPAG